MNQWADLVCRVPEATYLRVSLFSSLLVRTSRAVPKEAVPTGGTTCSRTLNAAAACNLAATDPLPVSLSLLGILFLCFVSAVSVTVAAGIVGVNNGMLANNLPAAVQVAQMLLTTSLSIVKLYNADQATLQAFANTSIIVAVGVTNNEISLLAASLTSVQSWVQTNVAAYMPATKFTSLSATKY
jgi:hypothetical protein